MEAGKPGHARKKRDDLGTRLEPILARHACSVVRGTSRLLAA
jgi:hypothetical protein